MPGSKTGPFCHWGIKIQKPGPTGCGLETRIKKEKSISKEMKTGSNPADIYKEGCGPEKSELARTFGLCNFLIKCSVLSLIALSSGSQSKRP